jgi:hypothetical protein
MPAKKTAKSSTGRGRKSAAKRATATRKRSTAKTSAAKKPSAKEPPVFANGMLLIGVYGPFNARALVVPDYVSSTGQEAIELAAMAGLILDPWQQFVLVNALGERADGKWAAFEVGVDVAAAERQGRHPRGARALRHVPARRVADDPLGAPVRHVDRGVPADGSAARGLR